MKKKALRKDFFMEIKKSLNRFISIFLIVALGVAFYSGIQSAAPDMRYSGDAYFDEHRLMDLKVISTMGLTKEDVEKIRRIKGIAKAEPGYMADLLCGAQDRQMVLRVESISETLNQLTPVEGRVPSQSGECFVDIEFLDKTDYKIGDTITFYLEKDDEVPLKRQEFTIVGAGSSPLYISFNRGNTTLGTGELAGAGYILPEDFDYDVYTQTYLSVSGASDLTAYTDAYDLLIETVQKRIEAIAGERCEIRYQEVKNEADEKLADAKKDLEEGKAEAQSELADAWDEIYDGEQELILGKVKAARGNRDLHNGEQEIADAQQEIADHEQEIADGWAQLTDGWNQLNAGKAELASKKKTFNKTYKTSMAEITSGEAQMKEARAELADGRTQYDAGLAQYQQQKSQYDAGETAYSQGLAEYESKLAAWPQQKEQLMAQRAQCEAALPQLQQGVAEAQQGLDGINGQLALIQGQIAQETANVQSMQSQYDALLAKKAEIDQYQPPEPETDEEGNPVELPPPPSLTPEEEQLLAELPGRISAASENLQILNGQAAECQNQAAAVQGQIDQLNGQIGELTQSIAAIDQTIAAAEQGFEQTPGILAETRQQLDEAKVQLDAADQQLTATLAQLDAGETELDEKEAELKKGKKKLKKGKKQIEEAEQKLKDSEQTLWNSQAQLESGEGELADAREKLADAKQELADARTELADAEKEIADNEPDLLRGKIGYARGKMKADQKIADGEEKIAEAESEIADLKEPKWTVSDRSSLPENIGYGENADRMRNIGQVFPVMFFLVAALISLTTMTRMVEEERTQIGTLKALGYGKGAIAAKYLCYAFAATMGGSIAGILFGEKFLPFVIVTAYKIMYHHMPNIELPYNVTYALIATGAALVSTMAATWTACYRELVTTPAVLMRPPAPKEGKRVLLERVPFIWKHLSFTWKSTVRNLLRYKKRFFMTVFGIGGCMALMLVGYGLRDSISDIAHLQFKNLQLFDGMVILDTDASEEATGELMKVIREDQNLENYTETLMKKVTVEKGKKLWNIYLMVPENLNEAKDFLIFRDRKTHEGYQLEDDGAILTEKIASLLGVGPGDTIELKDEDDGAVQVPIAAVTENYLSHYIYLTPALYKKCFGKEPEYNEVLFRAKEGTEDLNALGEKLLKYDAALSISYSSTTMEMLDTMLSTLNSVIVVLIVSAGLLAFVVLYNLSNININERKRELATIKVLGFYDLEVDAYVYRENILITIIGIIAGVFLGKILHYFVITTVEVDATMFGRNINLPSFLIAGAFTAVFSIMVNAFMHFKLKKIDMVESLKSVE